MNPIRRWTSTDVGDALCCVAVAAAAIAAFLVIFEYMVWMPPLR